LDSSLFQVVLAYLSDGNLLVTLIFLGRFLADFKKGLKKFESLLIG